MAWGLEARVPFLDKAFLEVAMNVRSEDKMFSKGTSQAEEHSLDEDGRPKMEKYILRKAFDVAPDGKVCRCKNAYHHLWSEIPDRRIALPSSFDFVETKGTVLGWRWVLLDRWVRTQPVTAHSRLIKSMLFLFITFFRLKDHAERAISDEIFGNRSERWPEETVDTKEAYFIRDIFDSEFV
jgi:asparagine synthase (glutamine-hydrolysing)